MVAPVADISVTIGADASEVVSESKRAGDALDGLADDVKKASRQISAAERKAAKFKSTTEDLEKVSQALGGRFGELTGPLAAVGDLAERGSLKMAGFAGGIGVVVAGFAAMTAAAIDVAINLDEYAEALDGGIESLGALGDQSKEANRAIVSMTEEATRAYVIFGSFLTPVVKDAADALHGLLDVGNDLAMGFGVEDIGAALEEVLKVAAPTTVALAEYGRTVRESKEAEEEYTGARDEANREMLAALGMLGDMTGGIEESNDRATESTQRHTEATRENREELEKRTAAILAMLDANMGTEEMYRREAEMMEANSELTGELEEMKTEQILKTQNTMREEGEATNEWWKSEAMSTANEWINAMQMVSGMAMNIAKMAMAGSKKSRKEQAKFNLDMMIAEATGNMISGSIRALADWQFPINFVIAGLVTAFGAAQLGMLVNQRSKLHTGGMMAPDEVAVGDTAIMRDERMAVFAANSGVNDADVARMNRGERPFGGSDRPIYLVMEDGSVTQPRAFARPDSNVGLSDAR